MSAKINPSVAKLMEDPRAYSGEKKDDMHRRLVGTDNRV